MLATDLNFDAPRRPRIIYVIVHLYIVKECRNCTYSILRVSLIIMKPKQNVCEVRRESKECYVNNQFSQVSGKCLGWARSMESCSCVRSTDLKILDCLLAALALHTLVDELAGELEIVLDAATVAAVDNV